MGGKKIKKRNISRHLKLTGNSNVSIVLGSFPGAQPCPRVHAWSLAAQLATAEASGYNRERWPTNPKALTLGPLKKTLANLLQARARVCVCVYFLLLTQKGNSMCMLGGIEAIF